MLPEQRKIIMENQKLLYSFRKRGTDLPEKALTLLSKKIDKAYKTMQKSIDELKQHNIILDSNDFLLNSSFAYFAGFYVTDDEVEVELLDFQLEPVLEKIVPALKKRVHYETIHEVMEIMKNMIDEISENVTIESISIIFNKCMNYQNNLAYCENGLDLKLYNLSVQFKTCKAFMPSVFQDVFVGDDVLAYTLYLREKVFESKNKLYELENQFTNTSFFRASKSIILNLSKIKKLQPMFSSRFEAILSNNERVIISRKFVPVLKEKLGL